MAKRILILEDNPERHKHFQQKFIGHDYYITDNASVAIRLLKERDWDFLFLDHDLGGEEMVPSGPGTGYEVAVFLERHPDRKPRRIIIHSMNPAGRERIAAALPDAVVWPLFWVEFKQELNDFIADED